jgi:hypothetical protein
LIFAPRIELVRRTTLADWVEIRAKTSCSVIVIHFGQLDHQTTQVAREAGIGLLSYQDMDGLEEYARALEERSRQETLRRIPEVRGCIYDFQPPSTLRGWVSLRGPDGLVSGLTISILKNASVVAAVTPHIVRLDLSDGDPTPVGFTVHCEGHISAQDIADGRVSAYTSDGNGNRFNLALTIRGRAFVK